RAIDRIAQHDEGVGRHLRECVETGTYMAYRPRDGAPVWTLDVTSAGNPTPNDQYVGRRPLSDPA
ncbi:MAG: hypothetical protein WBP59_06955, partial [Ilumatobacteraceae bacterium]